MKSKAQKKSNGYLHIKTDIVAFNAFAKQPVGSMTPKTSSSRTATSPPLSRIIRMNIAPDT